MQDSIVLVDKIAYDYKRTDEDGHEIGTVRAINNVSLNVKKGDFITILGHNGSGKSTLAKQLNALLFPSEGTVYVDGKNTADESKLLEIRQCAGMIFQNPDNQIIGTVVEEDVGFGPENMGVPTEEILNRVDESLNIVEMSEYRKVSPGKLSGGQKQRVSIAGVLAMHPKCIIMDEPTAMLDPQGRKEVIRAARALNDVEKITIILITHYMEEAVYSDRVFVMDHGEIVLEGTPKEIFSKPEELKKYHMTMPVATEVAYRLKEAGMPLPDGILSRKELVECLTNLYSEEAGGTVLLTPGGESEETNKITDESVKENVSLTPMTLETKNLTYEYETNTSMAVKAVDDVSVAIPAGQFVGLVGHTGSGKTTLVQLLDALIKPTSGKVLLDGEDIYAKKYNRKILRSNVGIVFQYPEYQLFETTVLKDVCYGPMNLGHSPKEAEKLAREALSKVGIGEDVYDSSPFELSGGQKRRAAIAGVLAMNPKILILDEPTAGLDPKGREEILSLLRELNKAGMSIVLVSHSMEDVAEYVDRILVLDKGRILYDGSPAEVFSHVEKLEEIGLAAPAVTYILRDLKKAGFDVLENITLENEAVEEIIKVWQKNRV